MAKLIYRELDEQVESLVLIALFRPTNRETAGEI